MNILLVEDNDDTRTLIAAVLRRVGYTVIEVEDGETAIQTFTTAECPIVLLDWMLPGMSGIEVARTIGRIKQSYIIMLTALEQNDNFEEAFEAGAREYLQKPFNNDDLLEAVDLAEAVVIARQKFATRVKKRGLNMATLTEFI